MANKIGIINALQSLKPNSEWALRDDVLDWLDSIETKPTQAEINTEVARLQAEYDSKEYARARAEAYPSWQEQMDMMYHDQTEGSRTWLDAVEAVKEAYPK